MIAETKQVGKDFVTEILQSGTYQFQVIGSCTASIYESVDGVSFSRGRRRSVVGSECWQVKIPVGGYFYLHLSGATDTPRVEYITKELSER